MIIVTGEACLPHPPSTLYVRGGKRLLDFSAAFAIGLVTLPIQSVVAVLVRRKLGHPVLFRQMRPGLNGQPFEMVKFRTMTDDRGLDGELLPDADRLPPFGQFLRSTSLDELPELYNVIKGDMSLVGPRPLLMRYLPRYSQRQHQRHAVRPGITGFAQVRGRNNAGWEHKFDGDLYYVENMSLALDLRIIFRTIAQVVRRADIDTHGHATAPEFRGATDTSRSSTPPTVVIEKPDVA